VHPTDFALQSSSPDPATSYLLPKQSSGSLCRSTLLLVSFVYIYTCPFLACSLSAASRPFTIAFSGVHSLIDHRLGVIYFSITLPLSRDTLIRSFVVDHQSQSQSFITYLLFSYLHFRRTLRASCSGHHCHDASFIVRADLRKFVLRLGVVSTS
jgi:hypothetical protein